MFRILLTLIALLSFGGSAAVAQAAVEYDFFLVEAFEIDYDLREVNLRDINESGMVAGTATHNGFYDGFLWSQDADKDIVPLRWPAGLNNLNEMVMDGTIYDYETGTTISVPPAGGYPVPRLMHINDHGFAVGYSECSCSNSDRTIQTALLWDANLGSRTIPVLGAKELLRINNSNMSIGNIRGGSAGSEGFVYNVDTQEHVSMTDLLPGYLYGRGWSELMDISENNVAAGRGWDGANVRGLTWSEEAGFTFLDAIPSGLIDRVYPRGINAQGQVVGWADLTLHNPRAFVWDAENGMRNLNDLVNAPENFILDWAIKINDQGWIIGIGHYGPYWGSARGFVLKPSAGASTSVIGNQREDAFGLHLLPNPVTNRLVVEFSLPGEGAARISVVDVTGREVARLVDQVVPAGARRVSWEPNAGHASGVYYVRLETSGQAQSKQFVLLR
jgi:probable HAF family extracellular repeat protein